MAAPTVAMGTSTAVTNGPSLVLDSNSRLNNRQRVVKSAAEKRPNVETFSREGFSDPRTNRDPIGKDLGNLIRGETVFERQKDLSQVRRELMNKKLMNKELMHRSRKAVSKPARPMWKRVISVFTKNLILLLVLYWLGKKIRDWVVTSQDGVVPIDGVMEFERRVSEVEALLKTTAKMMQAQVDVVDKKIESEIGSLRREMTKKVEENGAMVENQLRKLGDRTESLDESLADMWNAGFLKEVEFESFLNDLKASKEQERHDEDLNLDKIKVFAREIVESEIEKHAADTLGRADYALASGGARVIRHSEPFLFERASSWLPLSKSQHGVHYTAQKMLEPSFGEPGQCFALRGSAGFIIIRLRTGIIPEAITLEHVAKSIAYDRTSAPKDCRVSAWFQEENVDTSVQVDKMFTLADFTYDLQKSNVQTFNVRLSDSSPINTVRLDFISNHGNPQHTCIYRLRVHGRESLSFATSST